MNKRNLSEQDISTKYIIPAIVQAGWDIKTQITEQTPITDGRITVRGRLTFRGKLKRPDILLYYKSGQPIAVIEIKKNTLSVGNGMQQALEYADMLNVPFVFSTNGDRFLFHDKTNSDQLETEIELDNFPSPDELWEKFLQQKEIKTEKGRKIIEEDYYFDGSGRKPRYYQLNAVNATLEAIARGQKRLLLVMATGTGKTYTSFQIVYRLWKSKTAKRILFLADRNSLIDQTKKGDFKYFGDKMTIVQKRQVNKAYEVYLAIYQGLTGNDEERNIFKQFSPEFFDLIVIDECHRGSAREDSAWREVLEYFDTAIQIGLTATPKEDKVTSNSEYFGEPIYTYSLKQGIDDGFLAPYQVIRVTIDVDVEGWRPMGNQKDKDGEYIEDKIYNRKDFDRTLVIDERTQLVAEKITEFLASTSRYDKTIVFCRDIDHAERMRSALANLNADLVAKNHKYVMRITGDNKDGKNELENFIDPIQTYPVIATTSELMTTGVDAQTCKVIVLDTEIGSMTKFKQIIGRGTRINEEYGKKYFTILDFRNATDNFADPEFDGPAERVKEIGASMPVTGGFDDDEIAERTLQEELLEMEKPNKDEIIWTPPPPGGHAQKIYVNGIDVTVLNTRTLYFDREGKPVTISLKDYSRELIQKEYASLNDFLTIWKDSEKKAAIIREMEKQGIPVEELRNAVDRKLDLFDVICHVAFDQKPLTRQERANNVKKRNYFTKYGDKARLVLEALIDKYADEGIQNMESLEILKVNPIAQFGSPIEIVKTFGGKEKYLEAVKELEREIYGIA